ncbi:MAG: hypothetical protein BZY75_05010 [SAR202 cluster bacterium Io17-Chloro-G7]|nr:MAG: hypothetical protein BZY75_05010 [SAR202 cluster bacterium Io17-Chloro-G7]
MEMDNAEFVKRYVRIGMGVGLCSNLGLEPDDRKKIGVVDIDHLISSVTVGMYTLKGKSQDQTVRNFINHLTESSL